MANGMKTPEDKPQLSHISPQGEARMVDVADKPVTVREATASALVTMRGAVLDALLAGTLPKGDALATARVAAILGAKRTSDLIPMCHPLGIDGIQVEFARVDPERISVRCTVRATARTGVEMEALTGAAIAALTIYDMAKSADRGIVIGPIQLERKSGGRRGPYVRASQ